MMIERISVPTPFLNILVQYINNEEKIQDLIPSVQLYANYLAMTTDDPPSKEMVDKILQSV